MKTIKKLLIALVVLILVSCNSQSGIPNPERLKGNWIIVAANGSLDELNLNTKYSFDGKSLTTSKEGMDVTGTYTADDSVIYWKLENMDFTYKYNFEGKNLILAPIGGDQNFTLERN
jgi:hypothetical protein